MNRHFLLFVLALSVVFNVFFAAGYLRARAVARLTSQSITDELQLDDKQAAVFSRLSASVQEEDVLYRDRLAASEQELIDELGRDMTDLDRIRRIMEHQGQLRELRRLAGSDRFSDFISVLSPQQRERLLERMRRGGRHRFGRGNGREQRQKMLERFDANGDGRLDADENARVREAWQQRRRMHEAHRQEIRAKFDANGNGRLEPEEQAVMREWMMENAGRERRRPRRDGD